MRLSSTRYLDATPPATRSRSSAGSRSSPRSRRHGRCSASASSRREVGLEPQHARTATSRRSRSSATSQQDAATRRYRLGPRVLDLGFSAINSMELREIAAPAPAGALATRPATPSTWRSSTARTSSTSTAAAARAPGQREIDLNLHVGSRLPAYCTSMGKVLLAVTCPTASARRCSTRIDFAAARPEHDHGANRPDSPSWSRCASAASRSTTRSWPTGCARSPCPCTRQDGRGRGRDQPRRAPLDGLDGGSRRAAGAELAGDGSGHLVEGRIPP